MTGAVALAEVQGYLDEYLRVADVPDEPNAVNGLQVENSGTIGTIIAAVDASQAAIDFAVSGGRVRPLLLVHHGLFWDGNLPVTGRRYRRLRTLLTRDAALYAAHIPLDVHPEVGNNAVLARMLGITAFAPFDTYRGAPLGAAGPLVMEREALAVRLTELLGAATRLIPGGPSTTCKVGIITGGAGGRVRAARDAGCDTFITGEGAHHTYFDAMEFGVNVIHAGHYATEQVCVKTLAEHLAERYGVGWEFFDHPTGM